MRKPVGKIWMSGCVMAVMFGIGFGLTASAADSAGQMPGVYTVGVETVEAEYVSAEYPVVTGVDGYDQAALDTVNAFFKAEADRTLEEQEPDLEETAEEIKKNQMDVQVGYELTCNHIYLEEDLLSVMQYSWGYWGGAHGYGYCVGHSFDLATGEELTMGGLLGCDEETAKERVVNAYRQDIIGRVETVTEETIWSAFDQMAYWLTEDGMVVSIPQYGIASYAAGPQEVLVPLDGSAGGSLSRMLAEQEEKDNPSAAAGADTITVIHGIQADAADFIFPHSSTTLLTAEDLAKLEGDSVEAEHDKSQLAINEILARYGYLFHPESGGSAEQAYYQFNGRPWYEEAKPYCPSESANEMLYTYINEVELENIDLICEWQKAHHCYY